jgi:hypothetical protein
MEAKEKKIKTDHPSHEHLCGYKAKPQKMNIKDCLIIYEDNKDTKDVRLTIYKISLGSEKWYQVQWRIERTVEYEFRQHSGSLRFTDKDLAVVFCLSNKELYIREFVGTSNISIYLSNEIKDAVRQLLGL